MGVVRFRVAPDECRCGYLVGSSVIDLGKRQPHDVLAALPEALANRTSTIHDCTDVTFLPPVDPGTVVRMDGCYEHDVESEYDPHLGDLTSLDTPSLWITPTSSIAADGSEVELPAMTTDVRPGVELGILVGKQSYRLTPNEARDAICGYTVCRTLRAHDSQPGLYGYRMFPDFLGIGRSIVPDIDPPVELGVRKSGETVDQSSSGKLRFSFEELVSYVSNVFTLEPGDFIVTGDPTRITERLEPGTTVTAWIESIGRQTTTISSEVTRK
jgi:2-keto-4-pentenoate hydratase/2-oxohepta-3-ene-1,7-dioic acid hydratase in catechol pathway